MGYFARRVGRRRSTGSGYEAWLDERDAPRPPLSRADLHSTYDQIAAGVVAAGGGIQAVIAATELPTLENVVALIDPLIVSQAFDNETLKPVQPPPLAVKRRPRLRRLVPDAELLRRRAAGQPLRTLARDYGVAYTTLGRFFARPEVTKQLSQTMQQLRTQQGARRKAEQKQARPVPTAKASD